MVTFEIIYVTFYRRGNINNQEDADNDSMQGGDSKNRHKMIISQQSGKAAIPGQDSQTAFPDRSKIGIKPAHLTKPAVMDKHINRWREFPHQYNL